VAAQVLFTSWKPEGTVKARLLRAVRAPVLVMVIVAGLLVWPTPVVGKSIAGGVTAIPAATAPVPLRGTVAEVAIEGEAALKAPVAGPETVGEKTTPTVQVEPAVREEAQVFCTIENPGVTESASWLAAMLLVLLTVTVCA
jgi:hypothetical protein